MTYKIPKNTSKEEFEKILTSIPIPQQPALKPGFDPKRFSGRLSASWKKVDGLKFQKKLRNEWDQTAS